MNDDESMVLYANWKQGSQEAASAIFERYVARLTSLARSRLSPQLRQRIDPDDVVQSAYRVFFDRASKDEFHLERSGDLWRLMAAITLKKVHSSIEFHRAQKRDVLQDHSLSEDSTCYIMPPEVVDREPTPDDSVALIDEVQHVLSMLEPTQRTILELRLQGASVEEIAIAIQRSDRTVRRALEQLHNLLEARLLGPS